METRLKYKRQTRHTDENSHSHMVDKEGNEMLLHGIFIPVPDLDKDKCPHIRVQLPGNERHYYLWDKEKKVLNKTTGKEYAIAIEKARKKHNHYHYQRVKDKPLKDGRPNWSIETVKGFDAIRKNYFNFHPADGNLMRTHNVPDKVIDDVAHMAAQEWMCMTGHTLHGVCVHSRDSIHVEVNSMPLVPYAFLTASRGKVRHGWARIGHGGEIGSRKAYRYAGEGAIAVMRYGTDVYPIDTVRSVQDRLKDHEHTHGVVPDLHICRKMDGVMDDWVKSKGLQKERAEERLKWVEYAKSEVKNTPYWEKIMLKERNAEVEQKLSFHGIFIHDATEKQLLYADLERAWNVPEDTRPSFEAAMSYGLDFEPKVPEANVFIEAWRGEEDRKPYLFYMETMRRRKALPVYTTPLTNRRGLVVELKNMKRIQEVLASTPVIPVEEKKVAPVVVGVGTTMEEALKLGTPAFQLPASVEVPRVAPVEKKPTVEEIVRQKAEERKQKKKPEAPVGKAMPGGGLEFEV